MSERTWMPAEATVSRPSNTPTLGGSSITRKAGSELDKDAFLLLLVTQMQNQDPLNPMDDKETVAQLAQFSSLEQMQNLTKSATQSQAYAMMGKIAMADIYNDETKQTERVIGTVESVTIKNGETYVAFGGKEVEISKVQNVYDSTTLDMINGNLSSLQSINLVGKTIQAINFDEEGKPSEFVEGKVDYMKVTENEVILVIGNKNVYLSNVVSVAAENELLLIGKEITFKEVNKDGETEITTGKIKGVKLDEDNRYLLVDDQKIKIENISDVTEAVSLIGKELTVGKISGEVTGVIIKANKPVLLIGEEEVSLSDAKSTKPEDSEESEK